MLRKKIIGTLVPLSSLNSSSPNKSNGTFATGIVFLDWLQKTRQNGWQLLPLHQTQLEKNSKTNRVPSPYQGYGIGLDPKYLGVQRVPQVPRISRDFKKFISENKDWINDYALFCALTDYFGNDDWRKWGEDLRLRKKFALIKWTKKLRKEIDQHIFVQWQLHKSYIQLHKKAREKGVSLIGDLPFYLSLKSPLVWAYQDLFEIEKDGALRLVSGVPDGPMERWGKQVWNHPIYKWTKDYKKMLKFWEIRIDYLSKLFDIARFDHAKGFFNYGVIDLKDSKNDAYKKGPGQKVFEHLVDYSKKKGLLIFVEDSGNKIKELRIAIARFKIPGIKIFRFAYDEKKESTTKAYTEVNNYPVNCVAYTSTHDTETLLAYINNLSEDQKKKLAVYSQVDYSSKDVEFAKNLRNGIIKSPARIVVIPIQDWLLTKDRINLPGTEKDIDDPNWRYKLKTPIERLPNDLV